MEPRILGNSSHEFQNSLQSPGPTYLFVYQYPIKPILNFKFWQLKGISAEQFYFRNILSQEQPLE